MYKASKSKILIIIGITLAMSAGAVYAATDTSWYENNAYILSTNNAAKSALRWLVWGLTKVLCWISSAVSTLYDYTFGMIDITKYGRVNEIITTLQPVLLALIIASLAFLGVSMMVERQKKPQLVRNLLLASLAVSMSLSAFTMLNNMAVGFKDAMLGDTGATNKSYEIVNSNIIDLVALDKAGSIDSINYSTGSGIKAGAGIKDSKTLSLIDINEVLNYSDAAEGKDLYKWSAAFNEKISKTITVIQDGSYGLRTLYDGVLLTTIGNEFYYRYTVSYVSCWLQILAYMFMMIALSYKNVRIMYELVVARILAYLHAADITSGERLKQILLFIRDTYIVLGISILSVKLYIVLNAWVSESGISSVGFEIGGGILKGIISLFIAFCVIDGPNIAERLLGMDAGLSRSVARTWGAMEMGKHIALGGGRVAGKVAGGIKSLAGGGSSSSGSAVSNVSAADSGSSTRGDQAIEKMNDASGSGASSSAGAGNTAENASATSETQPSAGASGVSPQAAAAASGMETDAHAPTGTSESASSESAKADQGNSKMHVDFMEPGFNSDNAKANPIPEKKPHISGNSSIKIPEKIDKTARPISEIKPVKSVITQSKTTVSKPSGSSDKAINLENKVNERSKKDGEDR